MISLPILALAAASFGIGTTEFVIMGLLPEVAHSFGVSIPQAGYLVSGYAMGVVVGAPIVAIATAGPAAQDGVARADGGVPGGQPRLRVGADLWAADGGARRHRLRARGLLRHRRDRRPGSGAA